MNNEEKKQIRIISKCLGKIEATLVSKNKKLVKRKTKSTF